MTFTQDFVSLAYNVTAVEQTDPSSGTGPAYLLNGVSDQGYWYQVGLSWDWNPGYTPGTGFDMIYAVFDSSGTVVYPSNDQYLVTFGGQVNQGDTVLLNLFFSSTYGVVMLAKDHNTGASAYKTYSAVSATKFVGNAGATRDSNGFFTGLMTEWYHSAPYYSNVTSVLYSNPHFALTSGWMWMDEYSCPDVSCSTQTTLFWASTPAPVSYSNPTLRQEFDSHGATEYSDAYEFITGPLPQVTLTLSYSTQGGGSGYSAPILTYTFNEAQKTAALATTPTSYQIDTNTVWSVTGTLSGSTTSERWSTNSGTSGIVNDSGTLNLIYYHQYAFTLSYQLSGGGSPSGPSIRSQQFGRTLVSGISLSPTPCFLDSGSKWIVPVLLPGSNGEERWESSESTNGTVVSALSLQLSFQHQYLVVTGISPSIGGQITNLTGWHDHGTVLQLSATAGPGWKFMDWIGSGAGSYSGSSNSSLIIISSPTTEGATFYPGLKIIASSDGSVFYSFGSSTGTVSPGTSTTVYAPYRSNLSLEGTPSSFLYAFSGWAGAWQGNSNRMTLALTSPGVVRADFSYNAANIVGIGVGSGIIAVAVVLMVRRRRNTGVRAQARIVAIQV